LGGGKTKVDNITQVVNTTLKPNLLCKTGFILGLFSIFLGGFIGMLPIVTVIVSIIGLVKFDKSMNKAKWQGYVGLVLGILYTMVYLYNYGHI